MKPFLALSLAASLSTAALAQPAAQEPAGEFRAMDDFAGILVATTDKDWEAKWKLTQRPAIPKFTKAGEVPRGKKVFILTFFSNAWTDTLGKAKVRCDLRITAPTGESTESPDLPCFTGAIEGSPFNLRLATAVATWEGKGSDPSGEWIVDMILRDTLRSNALPLRTKFILK